MRICLYGIPILLQEDKDNGEKMPDSVGGGIVLLQIMVSAAVSVATAGNGEWVKWVTYICPAYRALDFCMGAILGRFAAQSVKNTKGQMWLMMTLEILYFVAVAALIVLYTMGNVPDAIRYDIFWLPASLAGVSLFYLKGGLLTRALTNRLTVSLGNVSGQAFLLHQIAIGLASLFIPNAWAIAVCSLAVTIVASVVYMKVEGRILQRTDCFRQR